MRKNKKISINTYLFIFLILLIFGLFSSNVLNKHNFSNNNSTNNNQIERNVNTNVFFVQKISVI